MQPLSHPYGEDKIENEPAKGLQGCRGRQIRRYQKVKLTSLWRVMTSFDFRSGGKTVREYKKLTSSSPFFQPLDQTSMGRAVDQQGGSDLSHHTHTDTNTHTHITSKHVQKYIKHIKMHQC